MEYNKTNPKDWDEPDFRRQFQVSPQAAPLVGVELNPGPNSSSTGRTDEEQEASSTAMTTTAQSLFSDGLHIIFSFLMDADWRNAILSCHAWYSIAGTTPSRDLRSLSIRVNVSDVETLQSAANSSARRHISSVVIRHLVQTPPFESDYNRIISLMPSFSSIRHLTLASLPVPIDVSALQSLSCLHRLTLINHAKSMCWNPAAARVSPLLQQLRSQVRAMTLIPHLTEFELEYRNCPHDLSSLAHKRAWGQFLVDENPSLSTSSISFPLVRHFTFDKKSQSSSHEYLVLLAILFPGVNEVRLNLLKTSSTLYPFARFAALQSITLEDWVSGNDPIEPWSTRFPLLLSNLVRISTLTHLTFDGGAFSSQEEWKQLFSHLSSVTSLRFEGTRQPNLLVDLFASMPSLQQRLRALALWGTGLGASSLSLVIGCTKLRDLTLEFTADAFIFDSLYFGDLQTTFDDPSVLPQLIRLRICEKVNMEDFSFSFREFNYDYEKDINTETYRVGAKQMRDSQEETTVTETPSTTCRLEPNPGQPSSTSVANRYRLMSWNRLMAGCDTSSNASRLQLQPTLHQH